MKLLKAQSSPESGGANRNELQTHEIERHRWISPGVCLSYLWKAYSPKFFRRSSFLQPRLYSTHMIEVLLPGLSDGFNDSTVLFNSRGIEALHSTGFDPERISGLEMHSWAMATHSGHSKAAMQKKTRKRGESKERGQTRCHRLSSGSSQAYS